MESQAELERHLERQNHWALQLDRDHNAALQRVADLQHMVQAEQTKGMEMAAAYQRALDDLELEHRHKTEWALETSAALQRKCDELAETVKLLDRAESTVVERTAWAQDLNARLSRATAHLKMTADSRWVKLGRTLGLGPKINGESG